MLRLRVKEVAQEKKMSINKLSQISQVTYHLVLGIFNNPYRIITVKTINRLAAALEVPATELLEDVTEDQYRQEMEGKL